MASYTVLTPCHSAVQSRQEITDTRKYDMSRNGLYLNVPIQGVSKKMYYSTFL